ncbi:MAG: hypothetical protein ACMUJM_16780 [bacterium]
MYCTDGSSPLITNNIIIENTAQYGGGIQCWDHASPTITNNIIKIIVDYIKERVFIAIITLQQ